jgi:hypothetical protein
MKKNNLDKILSFLKWYTTHRKWQTRLILASACLSIVKGDIMTIINYFL